LRGHEESSEIEENRIFSLLNNKDELLEYVMNEHGEALKRLIYTYVKDVQLAEDILQDVFVIIFHQIDTFKGKSSFRTWIYRVTSNKCKDHLKSWHFKNLRFTDKLTNFRKQASDSPEELTIRKQSEENVAKIVLSLPVKYRELIVLYYYKELSTLEISELLQENKSTIKTRLRRARVLLEKKLTGGKR
jgi:RNA polymerase sigma-70 factor (ECF subfamily)